MTVDQDEYKNEFRDRLLRRLRPVQVPQMQQEHLGLIEIISRLSICVKSLQQSHNCEEIVRISKLMGLEIKAKPVKQKRVQLIV